MIKAWVKRLISAMGFTVTFGLVAVMAFGLVWTWQNTLRTVTDCQTPSGFVMSESMEPYLKKGDYIFLTNYDTPVEVNDVIAYRMSSVDFPIIHRIVNILKGPEGVQQLLTMGDNNLENDRSLFYEPGQEWLDRSQVVGKYAWHFSWLSGVYCYVKRHPRAKLLLYLIFLIFLMFLGWCLYLSGLVDAGIYYERKRRVQPCHIVSNLHGTP